MRRPPVAEALAGLWLQEALRTGDERASPAGVLTAHVLSSLAHHRVEPPLHGLLLAQEDRLPGIADVVRAWRLHRVARQLAMRRDLAVAAGALAGSGAAWAVVKGPALAVTAYGAWHEREFGDLDVLVDPRSLPAALDALEAAGARLVDRNWPLIARRQQGEITLRLRHGSILDLHWHLMNTPERRAAVGVSTADLLSRRRTSDLGAGPLPVLAPEDALVHVALHALHGGADRLLWLLDVKRSLSTTDGPALRRRAAAWRAELPLAVVLDRVEMALGLPAGTDEATADSGWRRATHGPGRRWPVALAPADELRGRALTTATRDTQFRSAAVLVTRRHRRRLLAEDARSAPGGNPLHLDVPDGRAKAAWLNGAARSDISVRRRR